LRRRLWALLLELLPREARGLALESILRLARLLLLLLLLLERLLSGSWEARVLRLLRLSRGKLLLLLRLTWIARELRLKLLRLLAEARRLRPEPLRLLLLLLVRRLAVLGLTRPARITAT
jgi:hypothetical protein